MTWPFATLFALVAGTGAGAQQTFKHPLGYTFAYPSGWQVQETGSGIVVTPAAAARDAQGNPLELMILGSESTAGITRPDAPEVIAFFQQMFPGTRAVGAPSALRSGIGDGAVLTFEGTSGGIEVRQRIYVALHQGQGIFLAHVARKDLAEARDADARRIFVSMAYAQPANDPQVAGTWRREQVESSSGGSGYVGSTTIEILRLGADGTLEHQISTRVSGGGSGVSVLSGGTPTVTKGRYTAAGGRIIATIDGAQVIYGYSLFTHEGAPALRVDVPGESKPRLYTIVR